MNRGGQLGGALTASLTPAIAQRYGWTSSFLVSRDLQWRWRPCLVVGRAGSSSGADKKIVAPILIRAGITVVTTQARCIFMLATLLTTYGW